VPDLFKQFRAERVPVAIVIDEYGGMAGMVTVEDVIEEIVGEMDDEFHHAAAEIQPQDDGSYLLLPRLHLRDFNDEFDLEVESEEADTIAGYVLDRLGRLPEPGDEVDIEAGVIVVRGMDGPRIHSLEYRPRHRESRTVDHTGGASRQEIAE